jgi:hypothetical protein
MASFEKIRRLGEMGVPEIRQRLTQRLQVLRERWVLAQGGSLEPPWCAAWQPSRVEDAELRRALESNELSTASRLLSVYLAKRLGTRFCSLTECHEQSADVYRKKFPGRLEQVVRDAELLREHHLKVFGFPEVECGARIPWRRDLIHGTESGLDHWSRIPYLDFAKVGDSKVVWEPNRHQHLVTLALAYRLTGDERYAEEALAQWEDWQRENPHLRGINWASSLELAFRAWSWIWMIYLLAASQAQTGQRLAELTRAMAMHADFISANLSTYFSPNTHLLGEGFALFAIGLVFPELRRADSWREKGRQILLEEITRQVREDGSHAEQSANYHRYATDFFLCAAILADRNGCSFPAAYRAQLERMVEFMLHTAWPDGTHPMIGDADGGRLLPFGVRNPNDNRSTLSTAAVYFGREDFRERAGGFHEETLWLLGLDAATRFEVLNPNVPCDTSKTFPNSGVVVMRSGWQADANVLFLDAGPQGMDGSGHGHADALSVVCSAGETHWLVDPGTFVYTASREWRDYFRSTQAHNTLVVDGHGQAEPLETFKWRKVCPAQLELWANLSHLDFASGVHRGYARLIEPVIHRRSVVFVKPDHWLVLDSLEGSGTHALEFFFHFAQGIRLQVEEQACRATRGESRFLVMSDTRMTLETHCGKERPSQGWYSEDYGNREPAPVFVASAQCRVPGQFAWLLWPGSPENVQFRALPSSGRAWELQTGTQFEHFIFSGGGARSSNGEVSTDADFVFLRGNLTALPERMTLLNGSEVCLREKALVRADGKVEKFDIGRQPGSLQIEMQPAVAFSLHAPGVDSVRVNGRDTRFERSGDEILVRRGD